MTDKKKLTTTGGAPVPDNQNSKTAGLYGLSEISTNQFVRGEHHERF